MTDLEGKAPDFSFTDLSCESRWGIEQLTDGIKLFDGNSYTSPEQAAWLWFLLRASEDKPEWFPKGKWAVIQRLEEIILAEAKRRLDAEDVKVQVRGPK